MGFPDIQNRVIFLFKIKGFNIPIYIPLTTSKGNDRK